ncbi:MAG: phospholipase A [Psychromonas sp.]|nr:phospholipase A [Psychromonas sp.]
MRLILFFLLLMSNTKTFADISPIDLRIADEHKSDLQKFVITAHKPNYILPFNFNKNIQSYSVYQQAVDQTASEHTAQLQKLEVKFQFSFKVPIVTHIADLPIAVFLGYTQSSFWQAYNSHNSSPFRESNYEPEIFAYWQQNKQLPFAWKFKLASLHLTHQSNGRGDPISRSWNRIESDLVFEKGRLSLSLTPWYRIEEAAAEDNNPDLLRYYGHGQILAIYKINDHTFSMINRNNLESNFSRGSTLLSWSFPLHKHIRGYLQLFSGYGNSLIEYNEYTNSIGLGISLTDWL